MEPNWDLAFALDDPIHHYSHSHYLRSSSHNPSHMGRSYGNKNVWPPASALASITEDVRDLQGAWPPIPSIDNLDSPSAAAGDDDEQAVEFNGPGLLVMISFFFLFFILTFVRLVCYDMPRDRVRRKQRKLKRKQMIRSMLVMKTVVLKKQPSVVKVEAPNEQQRAEQEEEPPPSHPPPPPPPLRRTNSTSSSIDGGSDVSFSCTRTCWNKEDTANNDEIAANDHAEDPPPRTYTIDRDDSEAPDVATDDILGQFQIGKSMERHHLPPRPDPPTTTTNDSSNMAAKPTREHPKTVQRQKTNLIILSEDDENAEVLECPICLCPYEDKDKICWSYNDECEHTFHFKCIKPWLMKHNECPCCRNKYLVPPPGERHDGAHDPQNQAANGDEEDQLDDISSSSEGDDDTATTFSGGGDIQFPPHQYIADSNTYTGPSWATALFLQTRAYAGSTAVDRYASRGGGRRHG